MEKVDVTYDRDGQVLYVILRDSVIARSSPFDDDDYVIRNFGEDGSVVGLQLLDISEMTQAVWCRFFLRRWEIPLKIFIAVDDWLADRSRRDV